MKAVRLAFEQWELRHPGAPQTTLKNVVVDARRLEDGEVVVRFFRVADAPAAKASAPYHDDFHVPAASLAGAPLSDHETESLFTADVTLPGLHVAAFLLAAQVWDAYAEEQHMQARYSDLSEKNVVVQEQLTGDRLSFGVGLSPRVYLKPSLRLLEIKCDFQWDVDAASFIVGPTRRIC